MFIGRIAKRLIENLGFKMNTETGKKEGRSSCLAADIGTQ
jgi:hypothetical protein